jgi:DNA-binding beta-propeller fold protein YncE
MNTRTGLSVLLVVMLAALGLLMQTSAVHGQPSRAQPYEVWALDQGTDTLYVIQHNLKVVRTVPLGDHMTLPHMLDFTSDYRYGVIANPASGDTAILHGPSKKVLAVLPTGPGSHAANVLPDDSAIITAVIGDGTVVEIIPDWQSENFTIGRTLTIADDPLFQERSAEFRGSSPVCLDYTADSKYAYITLGPGINNSGVVIMDVDAFELVALYPPDEVRANCGTMVSPDGSKMYVNGGSVTEGHWYVFDTETHELLNGPNDSLGNDAHGLWFTPDGSELLMVNRASSNLIIIDPETDTIIDEIDFIGQSPDIIGISPDGQYAFITLRGPNPLTGPHAIAGDTPGIAVIDVPSRELVTIIEPDAGNPNSDFHGISVRSLNPGKR